jgi:Lrp/AsnC family transcriptional regulator for asnA, asnC and gidA
LSGRPKIDDIDVKILKSLLNDPRTSFTEIAKDCNMSTNAIRIRYRRLEETGVINGAIMQVNPKAFGRDCIAYLGIQTYSNQENNILGFLENTPSIIAAVQTIGRYDIISIAALKNVDDLADLIERISSHKQIREVETNIWVDVVQMDHPNNLIIEPFDGQPQPIEAMQKDLEKERESTQSQVSDLVEENNITSFHELDKTDLLILSTLSENARISFRKIAKKLGISTQSVIRKYKKLRKDVSPYSSITVDLRKLGYVGTAIFFIRVTHKQQISEVVKKMLHIPNIVVAIRTFGRIDIFAVAPFTTFEQLFKLKQEIHKIPSVKQTELLLDKPFSRWPLNLFASLLPKQPQKQLKATKKT